MKTMILLSVALIIAVTGCDKLFPPPPKEAQVPKPTLTAIVSPCNAATQDWQNGKIVTVQTSPGVQHLETTTVNGQVTQQRALSHCIPCSKARSKDEKFVCEGEAN